MRVRRLATLISILTVVTFVAAILPIAPAFAAGSISISPPSGPVGTVVTVTSIANFTPGAGATFSVRIDGGVVFTGTLTPAGAIPAGAAFGVPALTYGVHQVTVTTSTGDTSPAVSFSVTSSITPTVINAQVGSLVVLAGNGFGAGIGVTTYWDATTISTSVITDANGSFVLNLTIPQSTGGPHTITSTDSLSHTATFLFTVTPSLTLGSTSVAVGQQLTIAGSGFASNSSIYIYVNSVLIANAATNLSGTFTYNLLVPTTPHGGYTLTVSDTSGNTATSSFTVTPGITVNPAQFTGGSTISISGSGFIASSVVSISIDGNVVKANAATTDAAGSFSITGYAVPKLPGGSHTFQVSDSSGNSVTVNFNITQAFTIAPASGAPGTNVQVTGSGFTANTIITISFDGVKINPSTIPQTDSTGAFTTSFAVPPASGGNHQVSASDGTFSTTAVFSVASSAKISPVSGFVGTTVNATGSSFASRGSITITFDTLPVGSATADATGSFSTTFSVPQSVSGTHSVVVTDGTRSTTFSFTVAPKVTITPETGYVGTSITVSGTGYSGNGQISIKYDSTQITTAAANSVGSFAAVFNAPVSKGGNHSIIASDSANTITVTFAMDSTPPPVPTLSLPLNNTKADALAQFEWGAVTDPSGVTYDFEISHDNSFSVLTVNETGLTTLGYLLTAKQKLSSASRSKPYYWRVRAIDAASNVSDWSPAQSFYVGFVLASWVMYVIFAVLVVLAFLLGIWLGGRRRNVSPPPIA